MASPLQSFISDYSAAQLLLDGRQVQLASQVTGRGNQGATHFLNDGFQDVFPAGVWQLWQQIHVGDLQANDPSTRRYKPSL